MVPLFEPVTPPLRVCLPDDVPPRPTSLSSYSRITVAPYQILPVTRNALRKGFKRKADLALRCRVSNPSGGIKLATLTRATSHQQTDGWNEQQPDRAVTPCTDLAAVVVFTRRIGGSAPVVGVNVAVPSGFVAVAVAAATPFTVMVPFTPLIGSMSMVLSTSAVSEGAIPPAPAGIRTFSVPNATVPVSNGSKLENHLTSRVDRPLATFWLVGLEVELVNVTCSASTGAPLPGTTVRSPAVASDAMATLLGIERRTVRDGGQVVDRHNQGTNASATPCRGWSAAI